ncbi:MAG: DUF1349 domain-containing protein [Planctomycetota bacterium]|jgi:regulation of enolase protein 1 (concanavalin A-like superfamily)|nr:DUF1349 domain-containing protein [Planctomycetota bacterium]
MLEKFNANAEWFNPPQQYQKGEDWLTLTTDPETDFWQRTHYGFQRHNGHAFLRPLLPDFSFSLCTDFVPVGLYDQCGVMILVDADNWVKAAIEYDNPAYSRLGSVVTNLGYSDWATTDVSSDIRRMYYRLSRKGQDFLLETSADGDTFQQLRIFHLHADLAQAKFGLYACSPGEETFSVRFSGLKLEPSRWTDE